MRSRQLGGGSRICPQRIPLPTRTKSAPGTRGAAFVAIAANQRVCADKAPR